jgi:hypothetical protein
MLGHEDCYTYIYGRAAEISRYAFMKAATRGCLLATAALWNMSAVSAATTTALTPKLTGTVAVSPFPLQLQLRVPFDPTIFPSAGHSYLVYELHLTNLGERTFTLRRIEVLDAAETGSSPIATF